MNYEPPHAHLIPRSARVIQLREDGVTFKQIGVRLGEEGFGPLSSNRVRQIFIYAQRSKWYWAAKEARDRLEEVQGLINQVVGHPWGHKFLKHYDEFIDKEGLYENLENDSGCAGSGA